LFGKPLRNSNDETESVLQIMHFGRDRLPLPIHLRELPHHPGVSLDEAAVQIGCGERQQRRMTQTQLAEMLQSNQSRIAKAEMGDGSVSLKLLVRAMLATGAHSKEIGKSDCRQIGTKHPASHRLAGGACNIRASCLSAGALY
jgi:hypothetical protein